MPGAGATAAAGWNPLECAPQVRGHGDHGELCALVWRFPRPMLAVSSAPLGGGVGVRNWVVNAQVPHDYARLDPDAHLRALADAFGLEGPGVGMLTAVDVRRWSGASESGCRVDASVGTTHPNWAAASEGANAGSGDVAAGVGGFDGVGAAGGVAGSGAVAGGGVGTVNVVGLLAVRLSPAALVNTVVTVTEAKSQALWDAGIAGTGTPSDALCVACPDVGNEEPFGGPRSAVGSVLARAVHRAVLEGCRSEPRR